MAHFRLQTRNSVVWPFPFSKPICAKALVWCPDEWIMWFPRWQASLGKLMSTYWAREEKFHSFFLSLHPLGLGIPSDWLCCGVASHHRLMDAKSSVIGSTTHRRVKVTTPGQDSGSGGTCCCYRQVLSSLVLITAAIVCCCILICKL